MVGLGRRSHLEDWFRFKSSEWSRGVPPAGQSFEKKTSLYFWVSFTEFPDFLKIKKTRNVNRFRVHRVRARNVGYGPIW